MGYRGKVEEREQARHLRAQAWTLQEIAAELGVSKGTVSTWVRDVATIGLRSLTGVQPDTEHRQIAIGQLAHPFLGLDATAFDLGFLPETHRMLRARGVTAVPRSDGSIRSQKHVNGCATVAYSDTLLHRRVMARIEAITSRFDIPG